MISKNPYKDIDAYISAQPENIQVLLDTIRETIKQAAPEATEMISYQMPAFKLHGPLAYFAAYKNHIGFYPTPLPIVAFKEELSIYKTSKGAVQFPLDQPLPLDLITRMVQFMVQYNMEGC
jgi:uncharacterized protein YdhG (YjbR/CyaY superfamily)